TVTTTDVAGNSVTANADHPYTVDTSIAATIAIENITADDIINAAEAKTDIPVHGTVGADVQVGDTVTVTVGSETYTTTVQAGNTWTVDVPGKVLVDNGGHEVQATVTTTDVAGNSVTANADHPYTVDTAIAATITIDNITSDDVINAAEAKTDIPVHGTVGDDVKVGDTVTVTVGSETYTTTVQAGNTWTVDVPGKVLVDNGGHEVQATVTTTDTAGNTATANNEKPYVIIDLTAQVTINDVANDNVLNADESKDGAKVSITGTVGGDVKAGDTVTLTVDGKEIGTAQVVDNAGKLEWVATDIDGHLLATATTDDVTATVSIKDTFGNTASATDSQTYEEKTLTAQVTIDNVTADNVINGTEATETITLHGSVGGDVKIGDEVTITIDGQSHTVTVVDNNGQLGWSLPVAGSVLAGATQDQIQAHVSIKDNFGNTVEANTIHDYSVKTLDASITIDNVTTDNVINEKEAAEIQLLHGSVGGDVKVGDDVTISVDGRDYKTKVIDTNGNLGWQVEVAGSVLANATIDKISAVVSINDKAGNSETATAIHDYKVATLDVSVSVDSINNGKAITGEEHDNNTPITVTGSVGGDAKVGDTVTLHFGDKTIDATVEDHGAGQLGYTTQVPGGYFEPNQNDGFTGDVNATISISDDYGNDASSTGDKSYDGYGQIHIGGNNADVIDGTGYNDLLIGDSSAVEINIEPKTISFILDTSASMGAQAISFSQAFGISSDEKITNVSFNGNSTALFQSLSFDDAMSKLISSRPDISYNTELTIWDSHNIQHTIKYEDVTRIGLAKEALNNTLHTIETTYTSEQLAVTTFNLATFGSGYQGTTSFKYDPVLKQLVTVEIHNKDINDTHNPLPVIGENITEYLHGLQPWGQTDYDIALENVLELFKPGEENTLFFLSDGEDNVGGDFNINSVVNKIGKDFLHSIDPNIISMGMAINSNNVNAIAQMKEIAQIGHAYGKDSHYIDVHDLSKLNEELGIAAQKILGGSDTIHGSSQNDILFGDFMNYEVLGYKDGQLPDGLTPENALRDAVAKDYGKDITDINEQDIFNYIDKHPNIADISENQGGTDNLYGGAGDDVLFGQSKNDLLVGGEGNDILNGGSGNDILVADQGNDILIGGSGNDTFQLNYLSNINESATVTIKDLDSGDRLDLSSILGDSGNVDTLLTQVSSTKMQDGTLSIGFHEDKQHIVIDNITDIYNDLGSSTTDIITSLFNHHVFTPDLH
ncbi:hypothetical protein CTM97_18230, partial [Photobacterium phosphoreum]